VQFVAILLGHQADLIGATERWGSPQTPGGKAPKPPDVGMKKYPKGALLDYLSRAP